MALRISGPMSCSVRRPACNESGYRNKTAWTALLFSANKILGSTIQLFNRCWHVCLFHHSTVDLVDAFCFSVALFSCKALCKTRWNKYIFLHSLSYGAQRYWREGSSVLNSPVKPWWCSASPTSAYPQDLALCASWISWSSPVSGRWHRTSPQWPRHLSEQTRHTQASRMNTITRSMPRQQSCSV